MEFVNKITGYVLALVLGAILVGGLLIPTVEGIQTNIGEEITLTNDSAIVLREIEDGDVLKCVRTKTSETAFSDAWTLNDEPITNLSGTSLSWNVGLISDAIYMQINANSNNAAGIYYNMTLSNPSVLYFGISSSAEVGDTGTSTFTVTTDGNITVVSSNRATLTVPYTWGYVICNLDDGEYYSAETGGVGICKKASDLILCGAYTSGALDTMYSYVNGVSYVSNSAYTMTVDADLTKHAGTTDIYDITTSVIMSDGANDETFTPYRIFLPYEVTGHANTGTYYVMFGVISILGIVAIIVIAANAIRTKY